LKDKREKRKEKREREKMFTDSIGLWNIKLSDFFLE
jgi:hypothetical protein